MLEEYPRCIWCNCNLQYIDYKHDLATIERLSNSIGHLAGNCVICCLFCNKVRKSDGRGIPHVCEKCATEEAMRWRRFGEGWYCQSCYDKIPVLCDICDKFFTKNHISEHMRNMH